MFDFLKRLAWPLFGYALLFLIYIYFLENIERELNGTLFLP